MIGSWKSGTLIWFAFAHLCSITSVVYLIQLFSLWNWFISQSPRRFSWLLRNVMILIITSSIIRSNPHVECYLLCHPDRVHLLKLRSLVPGSVGFLAVFVFIPCKIVSHLIWFWPKIPCSVDNLDPQQTLSLSSTRMFVYPSEVIASPRRVYRDWLEACSPRLSPAIVDLCRA